jgi:arsenical pump membrane protein
MSNAASLLLPGSNLTNLIVLDGRHVSGGTFFVRMALPWVAAVAVTAATVAVAGRHRLRSVVHVVPEEGGTVIGIGMVAVAAVVVIVLLVAEPAPAVAAVGVVAAAAKMARGRLRVADVRGILDWAVLVGLFGLAVALGALGRNWNGPADVLRHLDPWATTGFGAVTSILLNNLPAAALLSARPPPHPLSLLIGLNVGPNLLVSGSLAWVLWYRSARAAGGNPRVWPTVRIGLVAAPLAMVAALGALLLVGHHT